MTKITVEKITSYKKADNYTNLISGCLTAVNLLFTYLFENWRIIFVPTLIAFWIFITLMKIKIIHENDPVKGFRYRIILWFGLILLGVVPIISYFGLPLVENFLRSTFGPPVYERATLEELRYIPSWHRGWSYFDSLFILPIFLELGIAFSLSFIIGKKLSTNIRKENKQLGFKLSQINKKIQYFSENQSSNILIITAFLWVLLLFGFVIERFYSALLMDTL